MDKFQKYTFRYRCKKDPNKKAVIALLKEIGQYDYDSALDQKHLPRPLLITDFFLEHKEDGIHICYDYPMAKCSIMKVDG
ncbi:MAG: hypothetical protein AAF575_00165 [Bacteroidota bacterium]